MTPKPGSPVYYQDHVARLWAEGYIVVRRLFEEVQRLGFTGCYTHFAQFVASWLRKVEGVRNEAPPPPSSLLARDPTTDRQISPQTAAILCIKPRGQMTPRQARAVDAMKNSSAEFSTMRQFAMRFRRILRSRDGAKIDPWLDDACNSNIYALQRFAKTLKGDLDAVCHAVTEPWSNGQTEGQISRLKTLKRTMGGRAGVALLRTRMMPLQLANRH